MNGEGGLQMADRLTPLAGRTSMTARFAALSLLLLSISSAHAQGMGDPSAQTQVAGDSSSTGQGIGDYLKVHAHGYLENFTILRNDTFKDNYHVASSRYRTSLQLS